MNLNKISTDLKKYMLPAVSYGTLAGGGFGSMIGMAGAAVAPGMAIFFIKPKDFRSIMDNIPQAIVGCTFWGAAAGAALGVTIGLVCLVVSRCPIFWKTRTTNDGHGYQTTTNYFLGCIPTTWNTEYVPPKSSGGCNIQ